MKIFGYAFAIILAAYLILTYHAEQKLGTGYVKDAEDIQTLFHGDSSRFGKVTAVYLNPTWRRGSGTPIPLQEWRKRLETFVEEWKPVPSGSVCLVDGLVETRSEANIYINGKVLRCVVVQNENCCSVRIWSRDGEWVIKQYRKRPKVP